jgi:hypothetical protein
MSIFLQFILLRRLSIGLSSKQKLSIQLCKNHDLKIVTTHGSSGFTLFNYEDEEHFALGFNSKQSRNS